MAEARRRFAKGSELQAKYLLEYLYTPCWTFRTTTNNYPTGWDIVVMKGRTMVAVCEVKASKTGKILMKREQFQNQMNFLNRVIPGTIPVWALRFPKGWWFGGNTTSKDVDGKYDGYVAAILCPSSTGKFVLELWGHKIEFRKIWRK